MGKKINLIGQKFGRLTVLSESDKRNASGQVYWNCVCECGKECVICGTALRTGHTKSCGCYNLELTIQRCKDRLIDLTGQKFGKLTVLERVDNIGDKVAWKCQCECGKTTIITSDSLLNKHTQSCGCIRISHGEEKIKEILQQNNIPFQQEYIYKKHSFPSLKYPRFDFYVNEQYFIEYDGKQHFLSKNVGWDTENNLEETQARDALKNQWCKEDNIPLIRIPYTHYDSLCLNDLLLETSPFRLN